MVGKTAGNFDFDYQAVFRYKRASSRRSNRCTTRGHVTYLLHFHWLEKVFAVIFRVFDETRWLPEGCLVGCVMVAVVERRSTLPCRVHMVATFSVTLTCGTGSRCNYLSVNSHTKRRCLSATERKVWEGRGLVFVVRVGSWREMDELNTGADLGFIRFEPVKLDGLILGLIRLEMLR